MSKVIVLQNEDANKIAAGIGDIVNYTVGMDSDQSGKVEANELFAYLAKIANTVFANFGFIPTGWEQIKAADGDARAMIIKAFADRFDLADDVAELLIEDWLIHINMTSVLIKRTALFLKKDKEEVLPQV